MSTTMDDKLKNLLLKTRNEATASFGPSHWIAVLEVLGFTTQVVEKDGRTVEKVRITSPQGMSVEVEKDPRYKQISFSLFHPPVPGHDRKGERGDFSCSCGTQSWPCYHTEFTSIQEWAKEHGGDLSDLASRALGMPTVSEEREQKEYKTRDWTHTGTCGVCDQNVKMEAMGASQKLVLHGYQRPGDGAVYGQCFGRGYLPHELSPEAAKDYLSKILLPEQAAHQSNLEALKTGKVKKITFPPRFYGDKERSVSEGETSWKRSLDQVIHTAERDLRRVDGYIALFENKVKIWKPEELPEVLMSKRFGERA